MLEVSELGLSGDDVVGALLLVRVDELGVVERGERLEERHLRRDLALEVVVEDLGATHGLVERHRRDVPSADLGKATRVSLCVRARRRGLGGRGSTTPRETLDLRRGRWGEPWGERRRRER